MRRHGLPPRKRRRNLLAPSAPKRAFESQNALDKGLRAVVAVCFVGIELELLNKAVRCGKAFARQLSA
jgi:hypothetical protein